MADEIVQTLGFDASQAITSINTLNRSLNQLNSSMNKLATGSKRFNGTRLDANLNKVARSKAPNTLSAAAQAAQRLGTVGATAGQQAAQGIDSIEKSTGAAIISWQTLSRIILAQTVVRGINAIKNATREAVTEVLDLQKRIAEIQTIADGQLGSSSDVFSSLQVTSETFGLDILDVAEAKYQELSNQVRGSADSQEFFNNASKFAITTNSSLTDSVNLLSSALNAYGKDASESAEISGLLFSTIKEGRVRASELASSLGRVLPLANALGVSLDEVFGSLVKITQGGTRADTGLTQILGVLNKLSKPTPGLQKAFDDLGVSNAEEGIRRSGGLLQFLVDLKKEAGNTQELVTFFNNVRAIQGLLSLVGDDADRTADIFDRLGVSRQELSKVFDNASEIALDNETQRFNESYQELRNTFRDLAQDIIPLLTSGLDFLNQSINTMSNNVVFLGALLGTSIATLLIFSGTMASLAAVSLPAVVAGITAVGIAFGPATIALIALTVGFGTLVTAFRKSQDAAKNFLSNKFEEEVHKRTVALQEFKEELQSQGTEFTRGANAIQTFLNEFKDVEVQARRNAESLNALQTAEISGSLQQLLADRKKISKEIQDAINKADQELERSADRQAGIRQKKEDFIFNRQIKNLTDLQRSYRLFEESRKQAGNALEAIANTNTLEDFDQAANLLDRRLQLAQEGLRAAEATGNRAAILRAERQVVTALNDQVNLEQRRSSLIEQRRQAAEAEAAKDRADVQLLQKRIKEVESLLSITSKSGILSEDQLDENQAKIKAIIDDIRNDALSGDVLDLSKVLGISELADRFENRLQQTSDFVDQKRSEIPDKLRQVFADTNAIVSDDLFEVAIDLGLTQDNVNQVQAFSKAIGDAQIEYNKLLAVQEKVNNVEARLGTQRSAFGRIFEDAASDAPALTKFIDDFVGKVQAGQLDVAQFNKELSVITKSSNAGILDIGAGDDNLILREASSLFLKILKTRQELTQVRDDSSGDLARTTALERFLTAARGSSFTIGQAVRATSSLDGATNSAQSSATRLRDSWKEVQKSIDAARLAAEQFNSVQGTSAPSAASSPSTPGNMFGGFRYLAAGGAARGTDNIPTMLSPGEFVVNAKSSRQFASQLNAMNAGVAPTFREQGGTTVNNNSVNVGDVIVNGTSNPDETARLTVSKIKREFRRGTSSF